MPVVVIWREHGDGLAVVGGWQLVAAGGWQLVAVARCWRLVVGSWWSLGAVLKGGPSQKKKSSSQRTPPY